MYCYGLVNKLPPEDRPYDLSLFVYIQDIIDTMGTPDIKVITGVRRSDKSELLRMFINYDKEKDGKSNIIYIDYNLDKFDNIKYV